MPNRNRQQEIYVGQNIITFNTRHLYTLGHCVLKYNNQHSWEDTYERTAIFKRAGTIKSY